MLGEDMNATDPQVSAEADPQFEAAPEAPAVASRSRRRRPKALSKDNLLVVGMAVVSFATVYLLSLRGGPAIASAEQEQAEATVDAALQQLDSLANSNGPSRAMQVVNSFYYDAQQRQIPTEELMANPFEFKLPKSVMMAVLPSGNKANSAPVQDEEAVAMQAVKSLTLQSVLMGDGGDNKAMISNNLLSQGQNIYGWTVKSIDSRRVVLTRNGQQYVLEMQ